MAEKLIDIVKANYKQLKVLENMLITPHTAQELLQLNTHNRNISQNTIDRYVKDMIEDRWSYIGDPIKISKTCVLLDAQHRLLAIIKANKAQRFNVQLGLDDESQHVMDTQKVRSAGNSLSLDGWPNGNATAAAVRLIHNYDINKLHLMQGLDSRMSNEEVRERANRMTRDLLIECVTNGGKHNTTSVNLLGRSTFAAFEYMFSRKSREDAERFMSAFASGEGLSSTSPILALRNRLMKYKNENTQVVATKKYAMIIKAWNAFRENKPMKYLNYDPQKEAFPRIK